MKRFLGLTLTLALVLAYGTSLALGKGGGGHGGGHGGGEHHGGEHEHHHSHEGHHEHHHVTHHGDHHAFDHDWHHHHPGGWGWGGGGYAWGNPWAPATYGSAAAWLGVSPVQESVSVDNVNQGGNTVYEEQQPVGAAALAASGAAEPGVKSQFMPLGVFSIAPKREGEAVALVQLAVSKEGVVRGTYYNFKTNRERVIQGAVNKQDNSIAWTVGPNGKKVFHTWLDVLTDPPGAMTVRLADGETHQWTIARYTEQDEKNSFEEARRLKAQAAPAKLGFSR